MVFAASAVVLAVSLAASAVQAQGVGAAQIPTVPANGTQIALVQAQYVNSGLYQPLGNSLAFGVPLKAKALLEVVYNGTVIENGQAYTASQVASMPQIYVYPASGANINTSQTYTLMLADAAALGNPDVEGFYRHYLANGVRIPSNYTSSQTIFAPQISNVVTYYAGPGPIAGTGAHRYAWLMFAQPSSFAAPSGLSGSGVAPGHWNVTSYVQSSGLGDLVAASFFTVQNGQPTGSVVMSSSVNAATLTPASSSGPTSAASGSAAPASATTSTKSAASSTFALSGAAAMLVALGGAFAVLA